MRDGTFAAILLGLSVLIPSAAMAADLEAAFGDGGMTKLSYAGQDCLADGALRVTGVFFQRPDGNVYAGEGLGAMKAARAGGPCSWSGGGLTVTVAPKLEAGRDGPPRVRFVVTTELADDADELVGLYVELGKVRLTAKPKFENPSFLFYMSATVAHNKHHPGIVAARTDKAMLAVCNEQASRPLACGFGPAEGEGKDVYPILLYTSRHPMLKEKFPFIDRRLNPGGRDRWEVTLRFAAPDADLIAQTRDLYQRYAKAYPSELKWPDRRPIGAIHPSQAERGRGHDPNTTNPRGYLWSNDLDVSTDAGKAEFAKRALAYARGSAKICSDMNAQGVIVWSIEGQEYPHAISYLGDPRSLPPEMEPVADEFFRAFKDANLRVGVCIRPQQAVRGAYDTKVRQDSPSCTADRARNMSAKIAYAKKRWGCTLFYLDSDVYWYGDPVRIPGAGGYSADLDVEALATVTRQHPDVLILPEWESVRSYAYAAPYDQLNYNRRVRPPADARAAYPKAFFVNMLNEQVAREHFDDLVQAVKEGNILFFSGWWTSGENKIVREIYQKAR